jgi:hypothetical protein
LSISQRFSLQLISADGRTDTGGVTGLRLARRDGGDPLALACAQTLYGVAMLSLAMLFIGIRNARDIAVWMTTQDSREPGPSE